MTGSGMSHGRRAQLDAGDLRASVLPGSGLWSDLTVVAETGSTNEDLVAAARAGAAEGSVLVAERQTKGRGRLGRRWVTEPGAALTFSVLLRPAAVPPIWRSWLPLLAGLAVAAGVRAQTGVEVSLKWPNDVLAGPVVSDSDSAGKLAGILAEQAGDAVVVGIGLNVAASPDLAAAAPAASGVSSSGAQWPAALAPVSLAEFGAGDRIDRAALLAAILRELEHWYLRWAGGASPGDAAACGLKAAYLRSCSTLGRDVRVELPGGAVLAGRASDVDDGGRLLVAGPGGTEWVSAGDVIHVR
jgi:BirA family transcriptional regulator, biotin operon repressor / biotin---[acetyl-CoA-carboxylase] ligase